MKASASASTVSLALSRAERQRWTTHYEDQLGGRLRRAIEHARHCSPPELHSHFGSLLRLLSRTRSRPELHSLAARLIDTLHPWPLRWAQWEAWQAEIHFAIDIHASVHNLKRQATYMGYLADVMFNTSRLEEAVTTAEQAIALARDSNAPVALAVAGCAMVSAWIAQGQANSARCLLKELLEEVSHAEGVSPRDRTVAKAHLRLRWLPFQRRSGHLDQAVASANQIVAALEALPDTDEHLLAEAYRDRSIMQWARQCYPQAVQGAQRAIQMFAEQGDLFAEAEARGKLGLFYYSMTQPNLAEKEIRYLVAMAERLHAYWHLAYGLGDLGLVHVLRGQLHQALECFQRAESWARRLGNIREENRNRSEQALVHLHWGEYETALERIDEGLEYAQERQMLHDRLRCVNWVLKSQCYAGLGRHELALQYAEEALTFANKVDSVVHKTLVWRCLAEQQPPSQQVGSLQRALGLARQSGRCLDEAACLLSLAGLTEDEEERDRLWSDGIHLLEQIGATGWLTDDSSPQNPPRIVIIL